jgi:hypothetical protein
MEVRKALEVKVAGADHQAGSPFGLSRDYEGLEVGERRERADRLTP